jgi:hypothetical protein
MSIYNKNFYDKQEGGSLNSAREILPSVIEVVKPKV